MHSAGKRGGTLLVICWVVKSITKQNGRYLSKNAFRIKIIMHTVLTSCIYFGIVFVCLNSYHFTLSVFKTNDLFCIFLYIYIFYQLLRRHNKTYNVHSDLLYTFRHKIVSMMKIILYAFYFKCNNIY